MNLRFLLITILATQWKLGESNEEPCKDLLAACPSYARYCNDVNYREFTRSNCPVICKTCPKDLDPDGLCLNKGGCQHKCEVKDKTIKVCSCFSGYTLTADGKTCTDIDECTRENICPLEKVCNNLVGHHECVKPACTKRGLGTYFGRHDCCKKAPSSSACGVLGDSIQPRVVGGNDSYRGQWPWQVLMLTDRSVICGGSLLNERWLVTAAHCFRHHRKSTITDFYFGVLESNKLKDENVQRRKMKRYILHPSWNSKKFENHDIALVELSSPVQMRSYVKPICLPNGEKVRTGTKCFAAGWGLSHQHGSGPEKILQFVDLPIVDGDKCEKAYVNNTSKVNKKIMLCGGYDEGGKDACRGDSGGPYVCQRCDSCQWFLAGITSFGAGCAKKGFYGVYTDVHHHEDWISKITGIPVTDNKSCVEPYYTNWSAWGACSISCGSGGTRTRTRTCMNEKKDKGCSGPNSATNTCPPKRCPKLGEFQPWSTCSVSCGGGKQIRVRKCIAGNLGDDGCPRESATQEKACATIKCPAWGKWGVWGKCSVTCGGGVRKRSRVCQNGKVGEKGCEGGTDGEEPCATNRCPGWSEWDKWSTCSATCAGGTQTSTRECIGGTQCPGSSSRQQNCNTQKCPSYGEWGTWSSCPVTCGGGTIVRTRKCMNGVIGQDGCPKNGETEKKACNQKQCPRADKWSDWGDCSVTCGDGERTRTRDCLYSDGDPTLCSEELSQKENCNEGVCPGSWSSWTQWSECNVKCGSGTKTRSRTCKGGDVGLPGCNDGPTSETHTCTLAACKAKWAEWEQWSECSETCARGVQIRTRKCDTGKVGEGDCVPAEAAKGERSCAEYPCAECYDISFQYCTTTFNPISLCQQNKFFAQTYCPQRCNMCSSLHEHWGEWGACSVPCGTGTRERKRECKNIDGGCDGAPSQSEPCVSDCKGFTEWSNWSKCSKTCEGGKRTRTRTCPFDSCNPDSTGSTLLSNEETCNAHDCPGAWGKWSPWSRCSVTCGNSGVETRTRECRGGKPGGPGCPGQTSRTRECRNIKECPRKWSKWSDWSACSVTCGGGERTRSRECQGQGSSPCSGSSTEKQSCSNEKCVIRWGEWDEWSSCDSKCKRTRSRKCNGGQPGEGECVGDVQEQGDCPASECSVSPVVKKHCEGYFDIDGFSCDEATVDQCSTGIGAQQFKSFCPKTCCLVLPCRDTGDFCGPGVASFCNHESYKELLRMHCPQTCNYC